MLGLTKRPQLSSFPLVKGAAESMCVAIRTPSTGKSIGLFLQPQTLGLKLNYNTRVDKNKSDCNLGVTGEKKGEKHI